MINTLSKINLSKIGWEGGRSTSIWIMSLNILFFFLGSTPKITKKRAYNQEINITIAKGVTSKKKQYIC